MGKFIIPKELITKIKFELDLSLFKIQHEAVLYFNTNEIELYNFCECWFNKLLDNCGFIKTDVGQYIGLFPLSVNREKLKVYFNIDRFKDGDWKDWFLEDTDTPATHQYYFYTKRSEEI